MSMLRLIVSELFGMFVDDGSLAILVGVLIALVSLAVVGLGLPALSGGLLLAAGCVGILAWSVLRAVASQNKMT